MVQKLEVILCNYACPLTGLNLVLNTSANKCYWLLISIYRDILLFFTLPYKCTNIVYISNSLLSRIAMVSFTNQIHIASPFKLNNGCSLDEIASIPYPIQASLWLNAQDTELCEPVFWHHLCWKYSREGSKHIRLCNFVIFQVSF